MIKGLIQILFFQGLGELISKFWLTSIPGPVIGLVSLLGYLIIRRQLIQPNLALVADTFSQHLGLLFIPAAVGVVMFLPQLKENAIAIAAALIGSIILTILTSAVVLKIFSTKQSLDD